MAFGALSLACPCLELAIVRVGGVAIRAPGKGDRFFEIASRMAFGAAHFGVHPEEWIFCF